MMERVLNIEKKQEQSGMEYSVVKSEIKDVQTKFSTLVNTIISQDEKINELRTKVVDMQAQSMRRNMVITGIDKNAMKTQKWR